MIRKPGENAGDRNLVSQSGPNNQILSHPSSNRKYYSEMKILTSSELLIKKTVLLVFGIFCLSLGGS